MIENQDLELDFIFVLLIQIFILIQTKNDSNLNFDLTLKNLWLNESIEGHICWHTRYM